MQQLNLGRQDNRPFQGGAFVWIFYVIGGLCSCSRVTICWERTYLAGRKPE